MSVQVLLITSLAVCLRLTNVNGSGENASVELESWTFPYYISRLIRMCEPPTSLFPCILCILRHLRPFWVSWSWPLISFLGVNQTFTGIYHITYVLIMCIVQLHLHFSLILNSRYLRGRARFWSTVEFPQTVGECVYVGGYTLRPAVCGSRESRSLVPSLKLGRNFVHLLHACER